MAFSFELETNKDLSFEDFVFFIEKEIDPREPMTLLNCREHLQMLTNNRSFLTEFINQELNDLNNFQKGNSHSVQSLMLYRGKNFYVRLNIWPLLSSNPDIQSWQNELYQYLKAHDHNFWFMTAGYWGSGYSTEIWEYDYNSVLGFHGETVGLTFLEKTTLPQGKCMLYRASKDVHTQIAPDEYSLSLNIMLMSADLLEREQFYFDTQASKIIGNTNTALSTRYMMFDIASIIGNNNSIGLLEKISHTHSLPHIRLRSFQTLATLTKDENRVWKNALQDRHKVVRDSALKYLKT